MCAWEAALLNYLSVFSKKKGEFCLFFLTCSGVMWFE